jgi:hypothetical protein
MNPILDQLILSNPPGTLLVPVCAKELFVLRTVGINWQRLVKQVVEAHQELMANPTGFGPVDMKIYVTRKYTEDNVMSTMGQSIDLPLELFEWPL